MKQKRTKHKRRNQRVYQTSDRLTINDDLGDCIIEKDKKGHISFNVPATIDGNRLTIIKQENENVISRFRKGGQSEAQ